MTTLHDRDHSRPTNPRMVSPISNPAAPGSQYGARRPENAGTKYTPAVSATDMARLLTSPDDLMKPIESRSLALTQGEGWEIECAVLTI